MSCGKWDIRDSALNGIGSRVIVYEWQDARSSVESADSPDFLAKSGLVACRAKYAARPGIAERIITAIHQLQRVFAIWFEPCNVERIKQ